MIERFLVVTLSAAVLMLPAGGARSACAGSTCGLAGNARFQVNSFLFPYTAAPAPNGPLLATPGATVMQGAVAPRSLVLGVNVLQVNPGLAPGVVLPLAATNTNVFQLATTLGASFPTAMATFSVGGRTGQAVMTWCPGDPFQPPANPGCASGPSDGLLRYTRTANQFGGPARHLLFGAANAALRAGSPAPCSGMNCLFAVLNLEAYGVRAMGGPFGTQLTAMAPTAAPGIFSGTVTAGGLITNVGATFGSLAGETISSFGGPWTTGMITVSRSAAVPPQIFITTGTDLRTAGGSGVISMVAGAVSVRTIQAATANVAWLTLNVPEPSFLLGSAVALAMLVLCHALTRARSRGEGRIRSGRA